MYLILEIYFKNSTAWKRISLQNRYFPNKCSFKYRRCKKHFWGLTTCGLITTTLKLIASSLNQPLKKNSSLIRQCLQAVTALTAGRSISKLLISVCQIGFEFHSLFYGSMVTMTFHTSFFVNLVCIEVSALKAMSH